MAVTLYFHLAEWEWLLHQYNNNPQFIRASFLFDPRTKVITSRYILLNTRTMCLVAKASLARAERLKLSSELLVRSSHVLYVHSEQDLAGVLILINRQPRCKKMKWGMKETMDVTILSCETQHTSCIRNYATLQEFIFSQEFVQQCSLERNCYLENNHGTK